MTTNNTFCPARALIYLDCIADTVNTIQAIAMGGESMLKLAEDEDSSVATLFRHIYDLAADAEHYYALRKMLESMNSKQSASA